MIGSQEESCTPRGHDAAKKVLVTGGAGFIGSHVADGYLARGDRVWIVDDLSTGKRDNLPVEATFIEMSIEDPGMGDLFSEVGFDLVNHHAAQTDVECSRQRAEGGGGDDPPLPGSRQRDSLHDARRASRQVQCPSCRCF